MGTKTTVVTGVVALLVGVGVGVAGEPETVTETVEAAGPTEEVEVEVTPESCLEVIDRAEEIGTIAAKSGGISIGYVNLIPDSIRAGMSMDAGAVDVITAKLKELRLRQEALTDETEVVVRQFNVAKADCASH